MPSPTGEMTFSRSKSSMHDRFIAGFVRQSSGKLIHCFGPSSSLLSATWSGIEDHVLRHCNLNAWRSHLPNAGLQIKRGVAGICSCRIQIAGNEHAILEMPRPMDQQVVGIVLSIDPHTSAPVSTRLDFFFASLILSGLQVGTAKHTEILQEINLEQVTESIVDIFDSTLRYAARHDKWSQAGRDVFREQVSSFTSRGAKVEFCLPAFPCKSSSTKKVLSTAPDRGEHIALANLHAFIQEIEAIYQPGAKLWIISDGHVFSDCSKRMPSMIVFNLHLRTNTCSRC